MKSNLNIHSRSRIETFSAFAAEFIFHIQCTAALYSAYGSTIKLPSFLLFVLESATSKNLEAEVGSLLVLFF